MFALVSVGAPFAFADGAAQPAAAAQPTAVTAHATAPASPARNGLAVGVELGDPSSATAAWFLRQALRRARARHRDVRRPGLLRRTSTPSSRCITSRPTSRSASGSVLATTTSTTRRCRASEIPDSHYGLRASVALAYEHGPLELYAELAPGVDVKRTQSCTLVDGALQHLPARPILAGCSCSSRSARAGSSLTNLGDSCVT